MAMKNELLQVAQNCRLNAYAPYSKFKVGAAVLTANNKIYGGCNVENASYPCGTCAEAGAVAAMIADGETTITEILIIADTECILPCGNCLQKIAEFGTEKTMIHSADLNGNIKTYTLQQLLPHNFKAGDIKC
ncbi:MAG: cytidine deaminase [Alphaproteobacteria bacterium]|nr:cytidine deaminase [Alphaproteobacteria bacterium]